eukprot:CAMPEP_0180822380 /NCGR_PEP_ID=MMETSP1038_2-20121128/71332_1 /TAXON_ID=632150 /ORGANISM="Azadinium spinosum, Strain 3D9" /LENGTH=33 /DNA_ID= /DNA_START= /DNA_END= /DNA_ORIENTATION=
MSPTVMLSGIWLMSLDAITFARDLRSSTSLAFS